MIEEPIVEINEDEKEILRHTLGYSNITWMDKDKLKGAPQRNYFYTSENNSDYEAIKSLISKGLMVKSGKTWDSEGVKDKSYYFNVTEKGIKLTKKFVKDSIVRPSRSKARYELYLYSETCESFIEWLQNKTMDDYRKNHGC